LQARRSSNDYQAPLFERCLLFVYRKVGARMRIMLVPGAMVAGLGIVLTAASSGAISANPPLLPLQAQRANHGLLTLPSTGRRPRYAAPAGCTTTYTGTGGSFVGIPGESNYAGAAASAVVAGESNESCAYNSTIAGGTNNIITAAPGGVPILNSSSFVGGGGQNAITSTDAFVGNGYNNEATGDYSFLGAGTYNGVSANGAFLGAGGFEFFNGYAIHHSTTGPGNVAGGVDSFVGAGDLNQIAATGTGSFIGAGGYAAAAAGGSTASNQISGSDSFIGAGDANVVAGQYAVIAGGYDNTASMSYSAVAGGKTNNATGVAAVVGGGTNNSARGLNSVIPGGLNNAADGVASFAAGTLAKARNDGVFVWSDNSSTVELQSSTNDQFLARASGGFYLYSNSGATVGVKLSPNSGTWGSLSDRTMKTNVVPLDDAAVLDKVAALPVSEWSYAAERGVRHVGPMAQDFYAAFGVGEDDRHITSIDEDGVALAAIKALHAENHDLRNDNFALHADNATLHAETARLHAETAVLHAQNLGLRREIEGDNRRLRSTLALLEARIDRLASRSAR